MKIKIQQRFFFISCFLLSFHFLHAQAPAIENLVFEGAGIRGIAYCGAIKELEQRGLLQKVKRVGGTSAGAITALLLSIGYGAAEIETVIKGTSFKKFNNGSFFFIGGINRVKKYFGWYRGHGFEQWVQKLILAKTGNGDITFAQLRELGYKDLYVTGTNLTQQRAVVFSYEAFPDMKVKDAVRISMSIPLYFEAVFMDKEGAIVPHPKKKDNLDILIDGGFIANFPIRLFDSSRYHASSAAVSHFLVNSATLGFRIDSEAQIGYDKTGKGLAPLPIKKFNEYAVAFYLFVLENLNRQTLTAEDWNRTVSIHDGNLSPRIRKLSKGEINTLITNGQKATSQYLTAKKR